VKFDDLIGILFLLLFIVGPALKGLFKPGEPLIEVEAAEEAGPPEEGLRPKAPSQPAAAPPTPPVREAPAAAEPVRPSPPSPPEERRSADKLPGGGKRRVRKLGLRTGKRAVLNGMLWHEILSEPVALKHRRRRRGAKLE